MSMIKKPFLRLAGFASLPAHLKGAVVAIGNFDGVHRGHQAVLQCALDLAREKGRPALVLTFEPHPRDVFKPDAPVDRLTPAAEKAEILRLMGFDAVIEQPFTAGFAAETAESFVKAVLCGRLELSGVVIGENFHFGRKRQGNAAYLEQMGESVGFAVRVVRSLYDADGGVISSSRIRALLAAADVEKAAGLLGYRYTVSGRIARGAALGRTLGFPTANMRLAAQVNLALGVYAVRLRRHSDGRIYDGVASFGRRPTVNAVAEPLLETYIFDFSGDLYDEDCAVSFFSFIRKEEKFDGLDLLVAQMRRDEKQARAVLEKAGPLSPLDGRLCFA